MATAVLDEWTEEKCLQLIREYRRRPTLWDQKDPYFFKKSLKPQAWQEIGDAVNISPDQCKHKMIILMSSFRREKAKIMHSIKNSTNEMDPSQVYKSTWFAFKEMAFLLDKESERRRQLHDSDDADEEDSNSSNIKLQLLSHHVDTPPAAKKPRKQAKQIARRIERKQTMDQSPQPQQIPGPSQTPEERDEEIKSFTSFIGNKMKRYTDTTKNAVQQAICEIIFRADQNFYENNCYEKFSIIDSASEADPLNKQMYNDADMTLVKIQNDSDSE